MYVYYIYMYYIYICMYILYIYIYIFNIYANLVGFCRSVPHVPSPIPPPPHDVAVRSCCSPSAPGSLVPSVPSSPSTCWKWLRYPLVI